MATILFRPVGLHELALIWDKGMRGFPPRLSHQPIFYPVANPEYARQIARDWNTPDEKSGFAGFVTAFELDGSYLSNFKPHTVGSPEHVEYWVPAESLTSFNDAIRGPIRLENGFFGAAFMGHVPDAFGLAGKDAIAQFMTLHKSWEYNTFDVVQEVSANRKTVFLNWLFWSRHDFSKCGINEEQRKILLAHLKQCWELNHIEVPLPQAMND
jgi:hypothetical protein